ncbi:MAG: hypothetical protein D8M58_09150 [Calditrichaeota bacterium]|nr:MAG: hypothetical protein DWQ03_17340 [Calditrichota bacterium]MBL1205552.1 hypothetical protein [Calditrichota bacterium]NOG45381.1 hypothetical protein [Calditrichota bacterium]
MAIEKTLLKAKTEMDNGSLWRAKEILQSAIGTYGYNAEIYENYGIILLKMSDLVEAGRFLFLSGVEKQEYFQSVQLFKKKFLKNGIKQVYSIFPKAAQLKNLSDYPPLVAKELAKIGFPETIRSPINNNYWDSQPESKIKSFLKAGFGYLLFGYFIIVIILGLFKSCELIT